MVKVKLSKIKIFLIIITLVVQCVSLLAWAESKCMSVPSKEVQKDDKNFDNFYKKFQQQSPECQQQVFHQMTDHLAHRRTPKVSTSNKDISDKSTVRQWSAWFQKEVEREINWWGNLSESAIEGASQFGSDMLDSVNTDLYYNSEEEFKKIKNSITNNIEEVTSTLVAIKDSQELKDMFEYMNNVNLPKFANSSTEGTGQKKVRVMGRVIKEPEELEATEEIEPEEKKPDKIVVAQKTNQLKNLTSTQDTKTQAGSSCTGSCLNQNKPDDDQKLLNLFKNTKLEDEYECSRFSPGEEKLVFFDNHDKRIGGWFAKMKRDGNYLISLPMSFEAASNYDGEVPAHEVPTHYQSVVQKCLDRASRKMIGPNGKKIQIKLTSINGVKSKIETIGNFKPMRVDNELIGYYRPKGSHSRGTRTTMRTHDYVVLHTVKIVEKNSWDNSLMYSSNINCPTIVHEILHKFGLQDTYPKVGVVGDMVDHKTGEVYQLGTPHGHSQAIDNKCRFIQQNDIMNIQIERWCNVFGYQSEDCSHITLLRTDKETGASTKWKPIQTRSLLKPSQFKVMVYGDCPVNQTHIQCVKLNSSQYSNPEDIGCSKLAQSCIKRFSKEI